MDLLRKAFIKFIAGSLMLSPLFLAAQSESIILKSADGQHYVLEVESEDTFSEVIDRINLSLDAIDHQHVCAKSTLDDTASSLPDNSGFKMKVMNGTISVQQLNKKVSSSQPRNYNAPLTAEEIKDISYIVTTLANESLLKLKSKESSLKKAGDRVDHVHPFQFLYCVFSSEELKVGIRNIQGRSWVGKSFMEGLTTSLNKENSLNNLMQYTQDFANRLNIDVNTILPTLQAGQWEKFVDVLIKIIPRQGNTGRYDL